tara:strand:+ start:13232 stop:13396 length:165 start_codon:yes stop_codon:yes gene_type:complete
MGVWTLADGSEILVEVSFDFHEDYPHDIYVCLWGLGISAFGDVMDMDIVRLVGE